MMFDYATLEALRAHHPAWRLLASDHAPLVASFLNKAFVAPNVRVMTAADLTEALEDELYGLREEYGESTYPKKASYYLDEWASPEKGWLRKFYRQGSDEAHFDLTPATEKAITWLGTLTERSFVGTESRLLTLVELLRQMDEGTESDPAKRIAELQRRRDEIDGEIAKVVAGDVPILDDTAIKDRFQQFMQLARELLSDFREVEQNFRMLDRRVRERIALWEGAKGILLHEIMGERDAIADSDQGRSFRAFWEFLMSSSRQEELTEMLARVLALPQVSGLQPDGRIRKIHYDWLEAGEHAQRTVAQLSQQLRRFLDDQAWLENRRIMDILHGVEGKALALRETPPHGDFTDIPESFVDVELPMERPLYAPTQKLAIRNVQLLAGEGDIDTSALYSQVIVDKARISRHIRQALQDRSQISLRDLIRSQPLRQGLAELVTYLQLGEESFAMSVDESIQDLIGWNGTTADGNPTERTATLPRVIFVRKT